MALMSQDQLGRCDFLDVLEEAVLRRQPIGVQLRSGVSFLDRVVDVVTEDGADYAVFRDHGREKVTDIQSCTRARPH